MSGVVVGVESCTLLQRRCSKLARQCRHANRPCTCPPPPPPPPPPPHTHIPPPFMALQVVKVRAESMSAAAQMGKPHGMLSGERGRMCVCVGGGGG